MLANDSHRGPSGGTRRPGRQGAGRASKRASPHVVATVYPCKRNCGTAELRKSTSAEGSGARRTRCNCGWNCGNCGRALQRIAADVRAESVTADGRPRLTFAGVRLGVVPRFRVITARARALDETAFEFACSARPDARASGARGRRMLRMTRIATPPPIPSPHPRPRCEGGHRGQTARGKNLPKPPHEKICL